MDPLLLNVMTPLIKRNITDEQVENVLHLLLQQRGFLIQVYKGERALTEDNNLTSASSSSPPSHLRRVRLCVRQDHWRVGLHYHCCLPKEEIECYAWSDTEKYNRRGRRVAHAGRERKFTGRRFGCHEVEPRDRDVRFGSELATVLLATRIAPHHHHHRHSSLCWSQLCIILRNIGRE